MTRIAQISYGIIRIPAPMHGAIEGHTLMISKELVRSGHNVTIIDRKYSKSEQNYEFIEGVKIQRLSMRAEMKSSKSSLLYKIRLIQQRIEFAFQSRRFLKSDKVSFDTINSYDIFAAAMLLIHNSSKLNVFYTHDSSAWPKTSGGGKTNRLIMLLIGVILRRAKGIIVRNRLVKNQFMEYSQLPEESLTVIPPAIDTEALSKHEHFSDARKKYGLQHKSMVLFVGRLSAEKGIEPLIKSADIVVNQRGMKDTIFVLIGPSAEFDSNARTQLFYKKIQNMIKEKRLENNILFTGFVALDELKSFFSTCDVFVLPSFVETFGQVITEAMFYGRPVIATRTPGALEQIRDGWNGYLVEIGNEFELAEKLVALLTNPNRFEIGENAKNYVGTFDSKTLVNRYLEFYKSREFQEGKIILAASTLN